MPTKTCCAHHVVGFLDFFVWESGLVYISPTKKRSKMLRNKGLSRLKGGKQHIAKYGGIWNFWWGIVAEPGGEVLAFEIDKFRQRKINK
jgi:hypothetical protein